jgi:hypothetical protein
VTHSTACLANVSRGSLGGNWANQTSAFIVLGPDSYYIGTLTLTSIHGFL